MNQKMIPSLIFPSKNPTERKQIETLKRKGLIYKAGPRLYTSIPKKDLAKTIRANWSQIISKLFPGTLLSFRSAIEFCPDQNGFIHLTSSTNRIITYPGLSIKFHKGPKPLSSDHNFLTLKSSSFERAILENLSVTKKENTNAGLPIEVLEKKLLQYLDTKGEKALNQLRDKARAISRENHWERGYEKLNSIIGALLGTRKSTVLNNKQARSYALGKPYDSSCIERLQTLFSQLKQTDFKDLKEKQSKPDHFKHKAFFEAYFSNYIEGTTFEIEEAEEIIFDKKVPSKRPKDAHDIIGTYNLVSNHNEMKIIPKKSDDLIELLKARHLKMMSQRPEVNPGEFKLKANRAGETHFVRPEHVLGTLEQGFDLYQSLSEGFCRAAYIMFLIAEVHPFTDGNGRIARIMMNAELVTSNSPTIIIPNVFREDYLLTLRALTRRLRAEPFIKMLIMAQNFSHLDFANYQKILKIIESRNWFREPNEEKIIF